jgi:hypothetical protein
MIIEASFSYILVIHSGLLCDWLPNHCLELLRSSSSRIAKVDLMVSSPEPEPLFLCIAVKLVDCGLLF